jgi:hypothetical protein
MPGPRTGTITRLTACTTDEHASFADGTWENRHADLYPIDPIPSMEGLLRARRDRALTARWGVWLAHRDPERGFQVRPAPPAPCLC